MFTTSDGQYDINPAHVTHIEASSHPNLRIVHIVGGARVSVSADDAVRLRARVAVVNDQVGRLRQSLEEMHAQS